ncbi:hypothetical protein G9464_03335 [Halostella sp. JP-L12]|uniref:cupredoxin domain-containing protein n=1 Tax=Halostella TaxID=1843185 RepID=UPI000EF7F6D5|nr:MULTISPECIES: plastocyanin/azurin family copper-binding protein [Halostella]NHN46629.1 hypothetical protein [Halostella sp. JP-L12]
MVDNNTQRRSVLKAIGAGTALSAVGGVAAAGGDDDEHGDDGHHDDDHDDGSRSDCAQSECIHPVLGYSGLDPDADLAKSLRADHEVDLVTELREDRFLPEFFFEPTGLAVEPGDVVRFNLATPDHTVTAYHPRLGRQRRVPEDVPPLSSPVLGAEAFWLYRFDEPGVYDLLCAPHEIFGMVTRVVVGDPTPDFGEAGEGARPPELTAALVYDDPHLDPKYIDRHGEVSWQELRDDSKEILVEFPEGGEE